MNMRFPESAEGCIPVTTSHRKEQNGWTGYICAFSVPGFEFTASVTLWHDIEYESVG